MTPLLGTHTHTPVISVNPLSSTHTVLTRYSHCFCRRVSSVSEAKQAYSDEQARQASALSSISLAAVTSYFSIHSASNSSSNNKDDVSSKDDIGVMPPSHSNSLFSRSTRTIDVTASPRPPRLRAQSMLVDVFPLPPLFARTVPPTIIT